MIKSMQGKKHLHRVTIGLLVLSGAVTWPAVASADTSTLKGIIDSFAEIIGQSLVSLLFGMALAAFIWGVIRMVIAQGDQNKREEGKKWLVWGILGMFVIVGLWGIVGFLSSTFGIGLGGTANPPGVYIQN
jgi:protein-S-isoprenylcysteine O-methyltransferase Ste14